MQYAIKSAIENDSDALTEEYINRVKVWGLGLHCTFIVFGII